MQGAHGQHLTHNPSGEGSIIYHCCMAYYRGTRDYKPMMFPASAMSSSDERRAGRAKDKITWPAHRTNRVTKSLCSPRGEQRFCFTVGPIVSWCPSSAWGSPRRPWPWPHHRSCWPSALHLPTNKMHFIIS